MPVVEYVPKEELTAANERIKDLCRTNERLAENEQWLREDLADANERIRELEKQRDDLVFWKGHYERTENVALTTERDISDKLEKALKPIGEYSPCADNPSLIVLQQLRTNANLALAEVEAMRKGENNE